MRVPLSWLAEWVALPADVEELAARLTDGGLEVDAIERSGPDLAGFVVGHVRERGVHPGADRLSLCRVDVGEDEPVPIVCGAPNVAAGQRVAVALPGARLPDGTRIKKSKIRGEASLGMICSPRELGLSHEHEGILVLDGDPAPGTPLDRVLSPGETVLEVAITANRGDCASILGMAREVAAHTGSELCWPEMEPEEAGAPASDGLRVAIDDPSGCHAYEARVVRGIRVGESPEWLARRLEAAGLRSINTVVDVTNWVLLELGQPLHAFDRAKLEGGEIRVRPARPDEEIETLDGVKRRLEADDLVVADGARAVALAGVMGGAHSEVDAGTTEIVIESAHFDPRRVRRTARRLGLHSDASYRFERGIDRDGVGRAADRAARLVAELCSGEVAPGRVGARGEAPSVPGPIDLDPARVERLLGIALSGEEIVGLLARVGIRAEAGPEGRLRCRVPSHRNDVALPEDLIEEVVRIHGVDRIEPSTLSGPLVPGEVPPSWRLGLQVREALVAEGGIEVMSFPFLDPEDLDRLRLAADDPRRSLVRVRNPIVESAWALRPTLVPTLLRLARENRNRQVDGPALFEVARGIRALPGQTLPEERPFLAALCSRGEEAHLWDRSEPAPLFFEAKGLAERLLERLAVRLDGVSTESEPYLHPGASCTLLSGKRALGVVGELHPEVASAFELDQLTAIVELDLSALLEAPRQPRVYREVSRHPPVKRDLAFLVDAERPAAEILEALRKQGGESLTRAELFDRYQGPGVPEGRVSLAFRLVFQRLDRSLTDDEVGRSIERIVKQLVQRFGAELR